MTLLVALPADSALARLETQGWSMDHELAALNAELTHACFRALLGLGGNKGPKLPSPLHVPRPWEQQATPTASSRPKATTPEDVLAVLEQVHKR